MPLLPDYVTLQRGMRSCGACAPVFVSPYKHSVGEESEAGEEVCEGVTKGQNV